MIKYLLFFILIFNVLQGHSQAIGPMGRAAVSSKRDPRQDYKSKILESKPKASATSKGRAAPKRPLGLFSADLAIPKPISVVDSSVSYNLIDRSKVNAWTSTTDITAAFNLARDRKIFLHDTVFPRRAPWLYPDDGCYVRSEAMVFTLRQYKFPEPTKVYAFGNLKMNTNLTVSGSVTWWYHVAIAYRLGNYIYVFDPSVNKQNIMSLEDWVNSFSTLDTVKLSFCKTGSYNTNDACSESREIEYKYIVRDTSPLLEKEWNRLLELKKNPKKALEKYPN